MDFLSQLLSKQQGPPPRSDAKKKQIADAKSADEARKKYLANYRLQATRAVGDFVKDALRLKMKFAPGDKTIRGLVHEIAEANKLMSHSFGEDGVDRYVYIYKQGYPLTEAELVCYREGRRWDPKSQPASAPSSIIEPIQLEVPSVHGKVSPSSTGGLIPSDTSAGERNRSVKRKSELDMARMSANSAEVVSLGNRESFGNVPVSVKLDRRTMAEVHSDFQAKKRLKAVVPLEI